MSGGRLEDQIRNYTESWYAVASPIQELAYAAQTNEQVMEGQVTVTVPRMSSPTRPWKGLAVAFGATLVVLLAALPTLLTSEQDQPEPASTIPPAVPTTAVTPDNLFLGGAGGGGGGGGGVADDPNDPHRLAEFVFGINGDRFGADKAELEVTLTWTAYGDGEPDVVCEYQGVTGPSGQVSYVDTGSSITVIIDGRIDGPVVGAGVGCDDELFYAELETFYANGSLDVESSFVDQDGVRCRRLLRSNDAGTASAVVETDDGVFIDATGLVGSGGYSREEFICPATQG